MHERSIGSPHMSQAQICHKNFYYAFHRNRRIPSPFCWLSLFEYKPAFPCKAGERGHISQATVLAPVLLAALFYASLSYYCNNNKKKDERGYISPSFEKDKYTEAGFLFSGLVLLHWLHLVPTPVGQRLQPWSETSAGLVKSPGDLQPLWEKEGQWQSWVKSSSF